MAQVSYMSPQGMMGTDPQVANSILGPAHGGAAISHQDMQMKPFLQMAADQQSLQNFMDLQQAPSQLSGYDLNHARNLSMLDPSNVQSWTEGTLAPGQAQVRQNRLFDATFDSTANLTNTKNKLDAEQYPDDVLTRRAENKGKRFGIDEQMKVSRYKDFLVKAEALQNSGINIADPRFRENLDMLVKQSFDNGTFNQEQYDLFRKQPAMAMAAIESLRGYVDNWDTANKLRVVDAQGRNQLENTNLAGQYELLKQQMAGHIETIKAQIGADAAKNLQGYAVQLYNAYDRASAAGNKQEAAAILTRLQDIVKVITLTPSMKASQGSIPMIGASPEQYGQGAGLAAPQLSPGAVPPRPSMGGSASGSVQTPVPNVPMYTPQDVPDLLNSRPGLAAPPRPAAPATNDRYSPLPNGSFVPGNGATTAPMPPLPQGATPPAPGSVAAPPRPSGVPPGSAYSPSRKMWKDPQGKLYFENGIPYD